MKQSRGVTERYREYLPVSDSTPIVSLGEGNTPLIYSPRLSERVGGFTKRTKKREKGRDFLQLGADVVEGKVDRPLRGRC
ncbi:MAG TPA: hypothetical protein VGM62_17220 [Chthoniobacterales bacterium]|jgi:threonine synthase